MASKTVRRSPGCRVPSIYSVRTNLQEAVRHAHSNILTVLLRGKCLGDKQDVVRHARSSILLVVLRAHAEGLIIRIPSQKGCRLQLVNSNQYASDATIQAGSD